MIPILVLTVTVIYSKKAFKSKHQFKEKPKSLKRHIAILTYSLPQQVHDPDGMQQEAEAHSQSLSPKVKKKTGANNQEPKREFLQATTITSVPGAGVGNQPSARKL